MKNLKIWLNLTIIVWILIENSESGKDNTIEYEFYLLLYKYFGQIFHFELLKEKEKSKNH